MFGRLRHRSPPFGKGTGPSPPPGPRGLPLLGSLLRARRDPLAFARDLVEAYGDVVSFKIGFYTGYLLNHPDHCRQVLTTRHSEYDKDNYHYAKLKPVLGEGLITAVGDRWSNHRRLLQPVFRRRHLATVADVTTRATREMMATWDRPAARGRPLDLARALTDLTLKVVTRSLFSVDARPATTTRIRRAFTTLNRDVAYRFKNAFVPPLWVPTARNRKFEEARSELDRQVSRIIDGRRRRDEARDDLLGTLLAAQREAPPDRRVTDREIRDEVTTLLLAGHETTANLLLWTLHLVSRHADVERRLRSELDRVLEGRDPSVEDLPSLEYLTMVLQESLRLYPPVWIISRKARNDDLVDGHLIPAGSTVVVCLYTLHRHPEFWDTPDAFDPGRFSAERHEERHPYAYLPFSGGRRSCIGQHFAMMEARLILAMIYQRYRLEVVSDGPVEPEPLVTLRPRDGLRAVLEPVSRKG